MPRKDCSTDALAKVSLGTNGAFAFLSPVCLAILRSIRL